MNSNPRFLTYTQLSTLPKPAWQIEGLFEVGSTVMVFGAPASYKSFMALDWMLCMATERKWNNRNTVPAKVLYILGEGKSSLLKRINAWVTYNGIEEAELAKLDQNMRTSFDVTQMASKISVDNLLAGLAAENFVPSVIVIDTLARSFVGMDENSQKDMGLWIDSAERLRAMGYTVIFLHHSKKNIEFGNQYRGSTVLEGAMDTAICMTKKKQSKGMVTMEITKQKDHDEGPLQYFEIVPVGGKDGSIVLKPTISMDERFTLEGMAEDELLLGLLKNPAFEEDTDRAKVLVQRLGISDGAARTRLSRKRKELIREASYV